MIGIFEDGWDYYISRAEISYNTDKINDALCDAKLAQNYADTKARKVAIGIFIAKCYSALHKYEESSKIYRELIKEDTYIPPVIMGMMYNNLKSKSAKKVQNNITLVKIFSGDECK
jgi:hypothetical protein